MRHYREGCQHSLLIVAPFFARIFVEMTAGAPEDDGGGGGGLRRGNWIVLIGVLVIGDGMLRL